MGSSQKVDPVQQAFFLAGQQKAVAAATATPALTPAPNTVVSQEPTPIALSPLPAPLAPVADPAVTAAQAEAAALRAREEQRAKQERISAVQSELRASREVGGQFGLRSLIASQVNARRSLLGAG